MASVGGDLLEALQCFGLSVLCVAECGVELGGEVFCPAAVDRAGRDCYFADDLVVGDSLEFEFNYSGPLMFSQFLSGHYASRLKSCGLPVAAAMGTIPVTCW